MFGASQCFRTVFFQSDGPTAQAALRPFWCDFSTYFQNSPLRQMMLNDFARSRAKSAASFCKRTLGYGHMMQGEE